MICYNAIIDPYSRILSDWICAVAKSAQFHHHHRLDINMNHHHCRDHSDLLIPTVLPLISIRYGAVCFQNNYKFRCVDFVLLWPNSEPTRIVTNVIYVKYIWHLADVSCFVKSVWKSIQKSSKKGWRNPPIMLCDKENPRQPQVYL